MLLQLYLKSKYTLKWFKKISLWLYHVSYSHGSRIFIEKSYDDVSHTATGLDVPSSFPVFNFKRGRKK